MVKEKISSGQFFALLNLFVFGTILVVGSGLDAKKDAWIAIFIGIFGGILLFMIYYYLYKLYPDLSLIGYSQKLLGKYIGGFIGLLYIPFLIYAAARDLRDVGGLIGATVLSQTPSLFVSGLMIFSIAYVLYKGMEVLARTAEIFWGLVIILSMLGSLFFFLSGLINIKQVLPVLEFGWEPVIQAVYTQTIMFPFGEMVAFAFLLPYINNRKKVLKTGISGILVSGILITYSTFINLTVLGVDVVTRSQFPLLSAIQGIEIMELIEHLDVIAVLTLVIGVFFKTAVFYYAAIVAMADLFKVEKKEKLIFPTAIVILYTSIIIADNFPAHLDEGKFALITIFPLFAVGFPMLYCLIAFIKEKASKHKHGRTNKNTSV
ncbi:spore germination protein KB [Halobacillus andaensis]|uniref:Spore germination protein KB n=1 Tax=Halobacillus andaensis TaxID=1176239 RepID=A0A917B472_HALAA|nr:GerAB/ArcD/ProY family transporter [Halobacillus andaensis]MBP2004346.1 spore germination protein KB [Halobacillus andaensis]GGF22318.1 spore germination protein KB [Halobacillus andaensis]